MDRAIGYMQRVCLAGQLLSRFLKVDGQSRQVLQLCQQLVFLNLMNPLAFHSQCHYLQASPVRGTWHPHTSSIAYRMFDFRHPNVAQIVGKSPEGSESPFIIYRGGNHLPKLRLLDIHLPSAGPTKRLQPLIAKALRTDLPRSIYLAMTTVWY
jgi:hypothetical protein